MALSRIALFALIAFSLLPLLGQPYEIGHVFITFQDSARGNRSVPVHLYYPADAPGDGVPVAAGTEKFPPVSFGHGFLMVWSAYENIWSALVPQGFIVALPTTEGGLLPGHLNFARDLAFVIRAVQAEGENPASMFFQRVDSACAVMGHSMGGGASFLAAAENPWITALANLAAAETNPSAIAAAADVALPSLVFAGGNDCVTPPAAQQIPLYNALASTCKTYIEITGATHCQFAENNSICNLGEIGCAPAAISRAQQHQTVSDYLLPWLKAVLQRDVSAWESFQTLLSGDPRITYGQNAELRGDVDGNSEVNSTDALVILSYDAALPIPSAFQQRIAAGIGDANADGQTNSTDALLVLSFDAGIAIPFPAGLPTCL